MKPADCNTAFFFRGERIASSFQLIRPLRIRQFSESWLAFRIDSGLPFAIKFLRREHPRIAEFHAVADFLKEQSSCPYLIRVFEYAETDQGMPYAVMEYAEGGTLREELRRTPILPLQRALFLFRGMLLALRTLHDHGIIHRDVKPENIWMMPDGGFRLGDLGIAKVPGFRETPGNVFGTASYMSPEQALDSTSVDARSDLYSLALILYEVLTGKRFRPGKNDFTGTLKYILSDRSSPPIGILRSASTENLAFLLGRMMERSASLRPGSASEVLAELDSMDLFPEEGMADRERD